MNFNQDRLDHIAQITAPHIKAMNEAIAASYPDCPDEVYGVAATFYLGTLLLNLRPEDRPAMLGLINRNLTEIGYRLVPLDSARLQ